MFKKQQQQRYAIIFTPRINISRAHFFTATWSLFLETEIVDISVSYTLAPYDIRETTEPLINNKLISTGAAKDRENYVFLKILYCVFLLLQDDCLQSVWS